MREPTGPSHDTKPAETSTGIGYADLGLKLAGSVLLFGGIGFFIDRHWGLTPWCMAVGATLGLVAGLYYFLKKAL